MSKRYMKSETFYKMAITRVPLGSQTFSKSVTQYPYGAAPLFIDRARGSVAIDIDGNSYIDFVASLGAVTIGYSIPSQNRAIRKQLKKGSIFSLPSTIEYEVAELIAQIIPSAEKVRFAKNGTDATSGAIRLSRAFTGKNNVITCGYHGWQDWYIAGTSKNLGVPKVLNSLVHSVSYGSIEAINHLFESLNGDVASIIIEPFSNEYPIGNYLKELREFCSTKGVVLIFDETVTGFRVSTGGAQELLGVIPDLSCFGKGIANGYPLAALVGRNEIMDLMSEVFLSGTFGGDTISLAAAKYTIKRYIEDGISQTLSEKGNLFKSQLMDLLNEDAKNIFSLTGHTSWLFHKWELPDGIDLDLVKTYFLQEVLKRGVMVLSTINIMYSVSTKQIAKSVNVYAQVLNEIALNLENAWINEHLESSPIRPLFKIRNT